MDSRSSVSRPRPWSAEYVSQILNNPPMDEAAIDEFLQPVRSGGYPVWSKLTEEQGFYIRMTRSEELDHDKPRQRKYWDPEDSTTWKQFGLQTKFMLSPSNPSINPDFEIRGTFVFELYFIEILKLDDPQTDFKTITISCRATNYTPLLIYKRPNSQHIHPHTTLPLKGPIRPTPAGDGNGVIFQIFDCMDFYYQDHPLGVKPVCDKPVLKLVKHTHTESAANLCYELITLAAKAHLVFSFQESESPIYIISGKMFAYNDQEMLTTRRIIKNFSSDDPPMLINDKELKVDRFVFGVPITSTLTVSVELTYYIQEGYVATLRGSSTFSVPEFWRPDQCFFTGTDGTRLGLTVHWTNV